MYYFLALAALFLFHPIWYLTWGRGSLFSYMLWLWIFLSVRFSCSIRRGQRSLVISFLIYFSLVFFVLSPHRKPWSDCRRLWQSLFFAYKGTSLPNVVAVLISIPKTSRFILIEYSATFEPTTRRHSFLICNVFFAFWRLFYTIAPFCVQIAKVTTRLYSSWQGLSVFEYDVDVSFHEYAMFRSYVSCGR